jgi:hypothetical protein
MKRILTLFSTLMVICIPALFSQNTANEVQTDTAEQEASPQPVESPQPAE